MDKVQIFDTTLRDGEQSPGASMNMQQKVEIAFALKELGVDTIEAGFPIASPGDFASVQAIARDVRDGPVIAGLARCREKDIERAAEALQDAERRRIHVFLATSPIHRDFKLKKTKEEIIEEAVAGIRQARNQTDDVEFSPEDAGRTEDDYLAEVVERAIDAGATTVNIPDTVGYLLPHQFKAKIEMLMNRVPNIDRAVVSVHCHNDLGFATANALEGVRAGARQVECTIDGIGERAGNTALEEIVMAMRVHREELGVDTQIDSELLVPTSRLVQDAAFPVQRNKAVVGKNAFAHEAGIHQDGMLKNRETYEIMKPEEVGWDGSELVLGKHAGMNAVSERFAFFGLPWRREDNDVFRRYFKAIADEKADNDKYVTDEELLQRVYFPAVIEITGGGVVSGIEPTTIPSGDHREEVRVWLDRDVPHAPQTIDAFIDGVADDESEGFINAGRNALREIIPGFDVADYRSQMVEDNGDGGGAAPAEVTITAKNGRTATMTGKAKRTDEADLLALANAFNALAATEQYAAMVEAEQE